MWSNSKQSFSGAGSGISLSRLEWPEGWAAVILWVKAHLRLAESGEHGLKREEGYEFEFVVTGLLSWMDFPVGVWDAALAIPGLHPCVFCSISQMFPRLPVVEDGGQDPATQMSLLYWLQLLRCHSVSALSVLTSASSWLYSSQDFGLASTLQDIP